MALSRKAETELIRQQYIALVSEFLTSKGEEVLRTKSNEIAIPVVGCEDNEYYVVFVAKVPTGANKGSEPYDGHAEAENYKHDLAKKARKAEERKAEKERKIQRDAEVRAKRKEIAEKNSAK